MRFLDWLRGSRNGARQGGAAHMTWVGASASRTISRTGDFLKRQIWMWPILAVVLLTLIGVGMRRAIETTMKESLRSELATLLRVESAMLETWFASEEANAESQANDIDVRRIVYQLLDPAGEPEGSGATAAGERVSQPADVENLRRTLARKLGPFLSAHDYAGYVVVDKDKRIIASSSSAVLGQQSIPEYDSFLSRALDGTTCLSPPFPSVMAFEDIDGRVRTGVPVMTVCAPIRDESFQVVAAVAFYIRPEEEFSRILSLGQFGKTGETYAFNKSGLLVSNSRFDEELIVLGLLPDREHSRSILQLLVRDPGGDITSGYRPTLRRRDLPPTRMAGDAVEGRSGVDVEGYRDYRGVPVVGAWTWLPDAEIGVATEIDYAEAFRPLTILQWTFWGLFALLTLSSVAIFIFTLMVARLRREAQKAAIEAQQIGQYKLEQKLGSGGMGVVYKGHHAMLRRPTAIKMLDVDRLSPAAIERFEREVQVTSQLNHPNTVAIYDYGRTPEGVFYYAMEFLDGIDLESLVAKYGPQPVPRVIHILRQICGSLYEAHSLGLVHRDIKPANIMLNRRGGEPDVVKVLDFGLVKALDDEKQASLTQQTALTGTPLYMSPEAIQLPGSVDARSDLYAVGAVGYFLLTGQPVFQAESVVTLCQKHVSELPAPPSERTPAPIPPELESAILSCLEKSRAKRPQTARDLAQLLSRAAAPAWSIEEADAWWGRHERGVAAASGPNGPDRARRTTSEHAVTVDKS